MKYMVALFFVPVWGLVCRVIYELFMWGWAIL
jgi:hypothetical protein